MGRIQRKLVIIEYNKRSGGKCYRQIHYKCADYLILSWNKLFHKCSRHRHPQHCSKRQLKSGIKDDTRINQRLYD